MLYDNGSTTQQLSTNEKNAQSAQELNALKEAAKAANEEKVRKQVALEARDFGRNEVVSEIQSKFAQAQQLQRPEGLSGFFANERLNSVEANNVDVLRGSNKGFNEAEILSMALNNKRNQNPNGSERLNNLVGNKRLSEAELNNINILMNSSKNWTDAEILDMALNN